MRRTGAAVVFAALLWQAAVTPAGAGGHCSGDVALDRRACEAGHHAPLVAVAGGLAGLIALIGSGLLDTGTGRAPGRPGDGSTSVAERGKIDDDDVDLEAGAEDAPVLIRPEDIGLPPVDAWGDPIFRG